MLSTIEEKAIKYAEKYYSECGYEVTVHGSGLEVKPPNGNLPKVDVDFSDIKMSVIHYLETELELIRNI